MARWSMTLMGMMVLAWPLVEVVLEDGNSSILFPEAVAATNHAEVRIQVAQDAADALRTQLGNLEHAYNTNGALTTEDWKRQLSQLQKAYQIRGDTDTSRPDPKIEGALHAALQQLHSIEYAIRDAQQGGGWQQVIAIKSEIEANLDAIARRTSS